MTSDVDRRGRVRSQLKEALVGVQAELAKCQAGEPSVDSEEKLLWIADGLEAMLVGLDVPKSARPVAPGIWHPVTDTWPLSNKLRHKLVEAESAYEKVP